MRVEHRHEYVYKTAIAQKLFIGRHSVRTASFMTEFRALKAKADVVILNGSSTVYEIKSERDTLRRLREQIDSYRKVFSVVNVVSAPSHVDQLLTILPRDVGVFSLTGRFRISTIRRPVDCPARIEPLAVLESIQLREALDVLSYLGLEIPDVPNTKIYMAVRGRFEQIDPEALHEAFLEVLKKSRALTAFEDFILKLPRSLMAAGMARRYSDNQQDRVLRFLESPVSQFLGERTE
jgi:hypothetical protein